MDNTNLAVFISLTAIVISFVSLYVNNLSPFKLKILHDTPTFTLYQIAHEISGEYGNSWWIPSFDIGISFYNLGRISGEIIDVRIKAELLQPTGTKKITFNPKWVVNYSEFQKNRTKRMTWIDQAVMREWYPVLLRGQGDVHLHIIFEDYRWDYIEVGEMRYCLEVFTNKQTWTECSRYNIYISEDMYEGNSSYTSFDSKIKKIREL